MDEVDEVDPLYREKASSLRLAVLLLLGACTVAAQEYRVAVLDDPSLPVSGMPTPASTFEAALAGPGVQIVRLDSDGLADVQRLNADKLDLLVVPTGSSFPAEAKDALLAFLVQGGDLLCTGGYAFDALWSRTADGWKPSAEQWNVEKAHARDPQTASVANGGFEKGAESWDAAGTVCSMDREHAFSGQACGQVSTDNAANGGAWVKTLDVRPGGHYLVGAEMKTSGIQGTGFAFLAVYQEDAQGKLLQFVDFVQVKEDRDWRRYETDVEIAPAAARVTFRGGLYLASGTVWLDEVTCAPLPMEPRINAHYGIPEDGLRIEPWQLTLFSPDQRIEGASLAAMQDSVLPADWSSPGPIEGFEASAQLQQAARWVPLVEARDAWGRDAGTAGAFVHHYAGPYAQSSWAIFGVTNRDMFEGEQGKRLLVEVVRRLRTGVSFLPPRTDFATYRRGETVHVTLGILNAAREARTVEAAWELRYANSDGLFTAAHSETRTIDIASGATQNIDVAWEIPPEATDFVQIHARLRYNGLDVDCADSGFCVYDEKTVARGTRVRFSDNAFTSVPQDGAPRRVCLFGTDTYANMFSLPAQSPWTWYKDLRAMRDYGLHMYENLQYTPKDYTFTEEQWRQLDGLIQLSQRFGLPYMAGLLIGHNVAVSDDELAKQAAFCKTFAARYKQTPGLIYYLNGDFRMDLTDAPDLRRIWNEFLKQRYASDDALRQAWSIEPPEAPLGEVPVKDHAAQRWYDPHARDATEFKSLLMRRWIGALCEAIREVDAEHPITSEYYQRPFGGMDLRLTVEPMDAANFGYFDRPGCGVAYLPAAIKWNDMRRAGKTVNIGEFGVKTHDAWSAERGGKDYHLQHTQAEAEQLFWSVAHAAWAFGVTKIQNWCWSDDPDRIFPWGLAWNNPLRAKPVLKLYRNLRVLSDRIPMPYRPADIVLAMPDTWRQGAPEASAHRMILNAIASLLATNTPFDVVNEAALDQLEDRLPKLIVMPFAYALPKDTLRELDHLAELGCCVYLSGDPSIAPDGTRDTARLEAFAGVRLEKDSEHGSGLPMAVVTANSAEPLPNPANVSVFHRPHGKGRIVWAPEPWEAFAGRDLFMAEPELAVRPECNVYLGLLSAAGIEPSVQLTVDRGTWTGVITPSDENRLLSIYPRALGTGASTVHAKVSGIEIEFATQMPWPSCVLLDREGRPLAATGTGSLSVSTQSTPSIFAQGAGAWMIVSLDGTPIDVSRHLAISATERGTFRWRGDAAGLQATWVERNGPSCHALAKTPITSTDGVNAIETEAHELCVIAPESESAAQIFE